MSKMKAKAKAQPKRRAALKAETTEPPPAPETPLLTPEQVYETLSRIYPAWIIIGEGVNGTISRGKGSPMQLSGLFYNTFLMHLAQKMAEAQGNSQAGKAKDVPETP